MGRPKDYSSPERRGRKVPQVHRLRPFVMLTPHPKSAAWPMARHKHFLENFQRVVIPLFILNHAPPDTNTHTHTLEKMLLAKFLAQFNFSFCEQKVGRKSVIHVCVLRNRQQMLAFPSLFEKKTKTQI